MRAYANNREAGHVSQGLYKNMYINSKITEFRKKRQNIVNLFIKHKVITLAVARKKEVEWTTVTLLNNKSMK